MLDKKFGASGNHVVVEEFLTGPEVSVLSFCDGKTVKPMVSSMDHKRALDHDEGLNTGGMGTVPRTPTTRPQSPSAACRRFSCPRLRPCRPRAAPSRDACISADADPRRPEGHRVQLPLRRP